MTKKRIDDDSKKLEGKATEELRPCKTFWFNAWKHSREEHILSSLLLLIMNEMDDSSSFSDSINVTAKSIVHGGVYKAFEKFTGVDISKIFNEIQISEYSTFLFQFSELLRKLIVSKFGKDSSKGAFVIFIDDLDRCPPNRVLDVLEAIKLFLDIPGCVFFLGMEVEQVKKLVAKAYSDYFKDGKEVEKEPFDVDRYMEKLAQIHVRIPENEPGNMGKFAESVLKDIVKGDPLEVFKKANFSTQRSLKRTANDYLFIESLCTRMKDISLDNDDPSAPKQLTRRGLAKWMVLQNRLPGRGAGNFAGRRFGNVGND